MATVREFQIPSELAGARSLVLSPDGKTVACRLEGERAGLWAFEAGGPPRALKLDVAGRRHVSPSWSPSGDLLFRIEGPGEPKVGALPAQGRGNSVEFAGSGLAVSADGGVLAIAEPAAGRLVVAVAEPGNSPFNEPLRTIGALSEADSAAPVDLQVTLDSRYVVVVRQASKGCPSLWSFPIEGGDGQELAPELPAPGFMAFALSKGSLAALEIRRLPQPSSRVWVRPLSAGSLGAIRLGPSRDLLFVRHELAEQHPGFSPDGKKLAVQMPSAATLPDGRPTDYALDLLPVGGGYPEHAAATLAIRGNVRFQPSGEVVVDGFDRVAVISF